jgi:hypothetical protein
MEIRFRETGGDFLNVLWANGWSSVLAAVMLASLVFLPPVCILPFLEPGPRTSIIVIPWLVVWSSFLVRAVISRSKRKESVLLVDSERISVSTWGLLPRNVPWMAIRRMLESRNYFFLKLPKWQYVYIPKRVLTPEQQAELRALIASHVPAK